MKLLEDNLGENLGIGFGNNFLDRTPKIQSMKKKKKSVPSSRYVFPAILRYNWQIKTVDV